MVFYFLYFFKIINFTNTILKWYYMSHFMCNIIFKVLQKKRYCVNRDRT
nr:MAG TPA: hypothetical protein [Caudoviricetes sp.]